MQREDMYPVGREIVSSMCEKGKAVAKRLEEDTN